MWFNSDMDTNKNPRVPGPDFIDTDFDVLCDSIERFVDPKTSQRLYERTPQKIADNLTI